MAGYEREVKKRLRQAGFERIRQPRGSHEIWGGEVDGGYVEVTVPASLKKRHTANAILKEVGGLGKV